MRKMLRQGNRIRRWGVLFLLLPLLSACNLGSKPNQEGALRIDPPPSSIEAAMLQEMAAAALSVGNDVVTVYLLDRNGYLAPMSLKLENNPSVTESSAATAIAWMTVNKQLADQLPSGFEAVLPEGTMVSSITEKQGTINIDFAAPFPSIVASRERTVIEALVWTLTELPGINKVKLSVAGQPIRSLPSSGLLIDSSLTRGLGINLEMEKGVQINRSMAVTLYFSAQSAEGEGYFVPVTRLINRQKDPAKAALEQLILGPQNLKTLNRVLTSDMTIEQLSRMADTVNVSLRDADWTPKSPVPAEMMEAIVLTLTEATGAPQVRVVMNGDDSLMDSDERTYDHPVTRPTNVNALSR